MARITMADVAKAAGVSKSTVSQFLNQRYEYMSEETRKKIELEVKRLGYQPNFVARSLKQKRTAMVGVIMANIMHRFSTEVSRAIEDYCNINNVHVILCNADDNPHKEKKYIDMLLLRQVDGLIVFPTGENVETYQKLVDERYPVIFMDRKVTAVDIPAIMVNNKASTYQVIEHFIANQHKRIAILTEPLTISTRKSRLEGYRESMTAHGLTNYQDLIISAPIDSLLAHLEQIFQAEQPPTALLAGNDLVFLEVLKFVKTEQLKIGVDFSLAVFDNLPFADLLDPAITTIAQPSYQMGQQAAKLLLKRINNKNEKITDSIHECELIIRGSSNRYWA
ncbi:transcriptional regulator, LacI family [Amphibacillus marinus]|uniref:Transcriptional regulator, LacI family n=1 Tax=Amphibacillus marinus TaxID=872970 RepID=A0A1H8LDM3_9BACI|nr:substrate-binding domain-containing protein [Amphibacillus marinus]SEO03245.1 transcriptional regulator, LacI family [Amphibacillus marinus]